MSERPKLLNRRNTGFPGFNLFMPLMIFVLLLLVNLAADTVILAKNPKAFSFFIIRFGEVSGNSVLQGSIINILNNASELVVLAIGMTLVTAASGGQDISVGAVSAIAGSVFLQVIRQNGEVTWQAIIFAFAVCCAAAMLCGAFNGALVAVFKIQPMIATLVLFTAGRSIANAVNGGVESKLFDPITKQIGNFFEGVPVPTPVFVVLLYICIFILVFKFTNLRLYSEAVGVNEKSAYLNGLNPIAIKILAYVILGFCAAGAGLIYTCRFQRVTHLTFLGGIEMDAILAVAIGGNALSGGKFSVAGSIIGAYTIETLNTTLLRLGVEPAPIKAYKAAFIILLMFVSSPGMKDFVGKIKKRLSAAKEADI